MRMRNSWIPALLAMVAMTVPALAETAPAGSGEGVMYAALGAGEASKEHAAYFPPSMRFDADAGSLEVTFGIEEGKRVSLNAFDAQGKLLAVMLDANQEPGFHHLSLFSNRLQGYRGRVVFQLRSDQSILAETRSRSL